MSDVGRTFQVLETRMVVITLTESDVEDQEFVGDTARQSVEVIANGLPENAWEIVERSVYELDGARLV